MKLLRIILSSVLGLFLWEPTLASMGKDNMSVLPTDSIITQIEKNYFNHGEYAAELIHELYRRAQASQDYDLLAVCFYWDALTEYSQRFDRSNLSSKIDSLLNASVQMQKPHNRLLLNYAKALSELAYGNFTLAFRHALDAHRLSIDLDNKKMITETAITLGDIGPYIQDYELSRHYYQIALNNVQSNSLRACRIQLNYSRLAY